MCVCAGGGDEREQIAGVVAEQNLEDYFRLARWELVLTAANWRINYAKGHLKYVTFCCVFETNF